MNSIAAVIVAFHPQLESLFGLIAQLKAQHCDVILVDNTPGTCLDALKNHPDITYIGLGNNLGIAAAQNRGIRRCIEQEYRYIAFFDQDSSVSETFLTTLSQAMHQNQYKICAPILFNQKSGAEYAITSVDSHGRRQKIYAQGKVEPFTSSLAISSGTLVEASLFQDIGLMDESLFIDYVDTEWCLRCFAKGVLVHIIPAAKMGHSIGDGSLKLYKIRLPIYSPARRYYRMRNAFHLLRYPHVPKRLACQEIFSGVVYSLLLAITQNHTIKHLKALCLACYDGLRNVRGASPHQI